MNTPMYHPETEQPVYVHPTQVKNMEKHGWTTEKPTNEEIENG